VPGREEVDALEEVATVLVFSGNETPKTLLEIKLS
jgi:hypothetical protein